ncbi:MAG: hypothetical protein ACOX81_03655 [Candidatus Heteroscillospira sp.]|jgi:hypothetical protein
MQADKRQSFYISGAFLLLCLVSAYRQISLRLFPGDVLRPYLVYGVYVFLLAGWMRSIAQRVTQPNMRMYLLAEAGIILLWMTVRFIQDTFLFSNILLMRASGYLIVIPAVTVPLTSLYATFGVGRAESYRLPRRWLWLWFPAALLILMAMTDYRHHLFFAVVPGEEQPNLYFHPYIGLWLVYAWAFTMMALRIAILYRHKPLLYQLIPFAGPILLALYCLPYSLSAFLVSYELIELSAGLSFIEAAFWEAVMFTGLVPVNTQYEEVFDRSTIAMQIVDQEGQPLARSGSAPVLSEKTFHLLRDQGSLVSASGVEMRLHPIDDSYLIWQKDVSELWSVIDQLHHSSQELSQESVLLGQELKMKSEQAAIQEQNRIYDQLTREVGPQLELIQKLLQKKDTASNLEPLFRRICLLGTYVKRRCNLRLIEQTNGTIPPEDLDISFRDMTDCLAEMGIVSEVIRHSGAPLCFDLSLLVFDLFEFLLEYERFAPAPFRLFWTGPIPCCSRCPPLLTGLQTVSCADCMGRIRIWTVRPSRQATG